jgi:hypothetical protein
MNRSKLQAPEFYAKPTPTPAREQALSTQPAWTDFSLPATIVLDDEIDDAWVRRNEACYSGRGGGGGASMWYYVEDPSGRVPCTRLEGPALMRYLARTGNQEPYSFCTGTLRYPCPQYRYNRMTGYMEKVEEAAPQTVAVTRKSSPFWNGLKAFLGIDKDS